MGRDGKGTSVNFELRSIRREGERERDVQKTLLSAQTRRARRAVRVTPKRRRISRVVRRVRAERRRALFVRKR